MLQRCSKGALKVLQRRLELGRLGWQEWQQQEQRQPPPWAVFNHTGAVPSPLLKWWKWHWDADHGQWHAKGMREGPPRGGSESAPGKHTARNMKEKERKARRLAERHLEDIEDPGGAEARARARVEERIRNESVNIARVEWAKFKEGRRERQEAAAAATGASSSHQGCQQDWQQNWQGWQRWQEGWRHGASEGWSSWESAWRQD